MSTSGAFKWNSVAVERPDLMFASPLKREARIVNMSALGGALTELGNKAGEGPRVHALFVYNSNPAAIAPNQNAVRRGMERDDLFTVVHEQFLTDTTDYADFILPATTFLEHTDVQGAYGHYYVQQSTQAIEPVGEARSNVWLFAQLAERIGFTEECFRDTPEEMIRQALNPGEDGRSRNPGMEHITQESLAERGHIPLKFYANGTRESFLPYSSDALPTPSGKIEFYSEVLAWMGQEPLPAFEAPVESRLGPDAKRYPLEFLPRKAENYMNSTFANLDGHRTMEAKTNHCLEIHPMDAETRGIVAGDTVRIWNDRGSVELTALLSDRIPAGVVAGRLDWNKLSPGGQNINALTSERLTDIGRAATFYSTLVEVAKV